MKSFLLLSSAVTAALAAVAAPAVSPIDTTNTQIPSVQTLPSWNLKEAIVKKIRYGPYTLPAATTGADGMLKAARITQMEPGATKPCDDGTDCMLLMTRARLEFADGSIADAPQTYLHHAAMLNTGSDVSDGTCQKPGIDMFFSTGNERSTVIFTSPDATHKSGYLIRDSDELLMQTEILNQEVAEKQVWVAYEFEILPKVPQDYQQTRVIWISANQTACATQLDENVGNVAPPNDKSFTFVSEHWTSLYDGDLLAMGGHLHDGGLNVQIFQNDKLICDSQAVYESGGDMKKRWVGEDRMTVGDTHLAKMGGCTMVGKVHKGDKFHVTASYDFVQHPGMVDKEGKLAPIMALGTMFIGADA
jgi:hypothetical protein